MIELIKGNFVFMVSYFFIALYCFLFVNKMINFKTRFEYIVFYLVLLIVIMINFYETFRLVSN